MRGHHAQKGVIPIAKRYNTPHRRHVVKTRMTEEEYADFTERLSHFDMSQAEFIRQAITRATIRPIITVSPVNDELLAAIGQLTAEYGKIGGKRNCFEKSEKEFRGFSSGASRIAGFGEGTPQQDLPKGQNRRYADFGTVVESCSEKLPLSSVRLLLIPTKPQRGK